MPKQKEAEKTLEEEKVEYPAAQQEDNAPSANPTTNILLIAHQVNMHDASTLVTNQAAEGSHVTTPVHIQTLHELVPWRERSEKLKEAEPIYGLLPQNTLFTDRSKELAMIQHRLKHGGLLAICSTETHSSTQAQLAITGGGGFGKGQLAKEYLYRLRSKAPGAHVYQLVSWINAKDESSLLQDYKRLAKKLQHPLINATEPTFFLLYRKE